MAVGLLYSTRGEHLPAEPPRPLRGSVTPARGLLTMI
jgi:hypothetical protein